MLERIDQPLAVDPPLLREIRAAHGARRSRTAATAQGDAAAPGHRAPARPTRCPTSTRGCFGLGSRDLQPGDIIAAVDNMLPGRRSGRRQFYLGIDFVRAGHATCPSSRSGRSSCSRPTRTSRTWRCAPSGDVEPAARGLDLAPHPLRGRLGRDHDGQEPRPDRRPSCSACTSRPTRSTAPRRRASRPRSTPSLAHEPIRLNCELKHVDVVLSPDPNVFRHSNPLAGLAEGGVFVIQSDLHARGALGLACRARRSTTIREKKIRVSSTSTPSRSPADEASDAELRYRMQGAAFMGAFFRASPLHGAARASTRSGSSRASRAQLEKKFGQLGEQRGGGQPARHPPRLRRGAPSSTAPTCADDRRPRPAARRRHARGPRRRRRRSRASATRGRFWEQVCHLYKTGEDGIADPFAAISAIPAATSAIRDMTDIRFEVPEFIADKCTGCSQCWVQCPDAAIPGLVNTVEEVLDGGDRTRRRTARPSTACSQVVQAPRRARSRRVLQGGAVHDLRRRARRRAYDERRPEARPRPRAARRARRGVRTPVAASLADFPLAKTAPFFDVPESAGEGHRRPALDHRQPRGLQGLQHLRRGLPDGALVTVKQDDEVVDKLRRNWELWEQLPDTDDRFVNIASLDEGIGVLPSLLLKKDNYRSMVGGDGACMGCGEKTAVHLVALRGQRA